MKRRGRYQPSAIEQSMTKQALRNFDAILLNRGIRPSMGADMKTPPRPEDSLEERLRIQNALTALQRDLQSKGKS